MFSRAASAIRIEISYSFAALAISRHAVCVQDVILAYGSVDLDGLYAKSFGFIRERFEVFDVKATPDPESVNPHHGGETCEYGEDAEKCGHGFDVMLEEMAILSWEIKGLNSENQRRD